MSCPLLLLYPSSLVLHARDKAGDTQCLFSVPVGFTFTSLGLYWDAMNWPASLILTLLLEGQKPD